MVTEWIMSAFAAVVSTVLGWIVLPEVPAFIGEAPAFISEVGTYLHGTGAWIPWGLLGSVVAAVVVAFGVMVTIKLVRIVASFLTLGGGSAA